MTCCVPSAAPIIWDSAFIACPGADSIGDPFSLLSVLCKPLCFIELAQAVDPVAQARRVVTRRIS